MERGDLVYGEIITQGAASCKGSTQGQVVSPNDVSDLAAQLNDIAGSWELFLGMLEVPRAVQEQIKLQHDKHPKYAQICLLDGLQHWVLSDLSPTIERVIKALRSDVIDNEPLAFEMSRKWGIQEPKEACGSEEIEEYPIITVESKPKLRHLKLLPDVKIPIKVVAEIAADWVRVAKNLGIPDDISLQIALQKRDPEDQATEMLRRWLGGGYKKPVTWHTLLMVLFSSKYGSLALRLRKILL